eukprot:Hpha_TRINITY_DN16278_c3_g1::TRINITY_DN16278_c3_g1_i6::g.12461::m.12461
MLGRCSKRHPGFRSGGPAGPATGPAGLLGKRTAVCGRLAEAGCRTGTGINNHQLEKEVNERRASTAGYTLRGFETRVNKQATGHSLVALHELDHVFLHLLDVLDGLGVVHRDTDCVGGDAQGVGTDVEPAQLLAGLGQEQVDQVLVLLRSAVTDGEHNLHPRAVPLVGHERLVEPVAPVDNVVQQAAAALGKVLEVRDTAALKHPVAHQLAHPDGHDHRHVPDLVRRVVKHLPTAHRRRAGHDRLVLDDRLPDHTEAEPAGAEVLVCRGVQEIVLAHVHGLRAQVGTLVGAEQHALRHHVVREVEELETLARVRTGVVDVSSLRVDLPRLRLGHREVHPSRVLSNPVHAAVHVRLTRRLLRPVPVHHVVAGLDPRRVRRLRSAHQVHRHGGELQRRTTVEEEHLVRVRDTDHLPKLLLSPLLDLVEPASAVTHLSHTDAFALPVHKVLLRTLKDLQGQRGVPRAKV